MALEPRSEPPDEALPPASPPRAPSRWVSQIVRHFPTVVAACAVIFAGSTAAAIAWFAASRAAYVVFVGLSLRARRRRGPRADRAADEAEWRRFRTRASWLMDNDALAFLALCAVTAGSIHVPAPGWVVTTVALVLMAGGVALKTWASASLPDGSYHWRDVFVEGATRTLSATGPYRWLSNPMYTLGYAHAYGVALLVRSGHALVGAAAAHATILLLHALVERPHVRDRTRSD